MAIQQIVEIARATSDKPGADSDEPTSALGERETERLFQVLQMLRDRGVGIIYVSHKLDEVFAISDRITVLKDGKLVGTARPRIHPRMPLCRMMVGRELEHLFPPRNGGDEKPYWSCGISGPGYSNVSLSIYTGEVLGVFGLTCRANRVSPRHLRHRASYGGDILIRGQPVRITDPDKAMSEGIAYIPEDRKQDGLFSRCPFENVAAACLVR